MVSVTNGRLLFNELPAGFPEPGKTTVYDTSNTIDLESVALNDGFLVKTLVLSIDPYLRGKMRDASIKSYTPAFELGKPLYGFGVGVVLRSENDAFKPGDHLYGNSIPYEQYFIDNDPSKYRVLTNEEEIPWTAYVGVSGMAGQTAYFGWSEYAKPKKGETVFVTSGGGAVGSVVIQLAKAQGLKVIASAGSEDKIAFMKSIGADVVFNYKTASTADVLAKEGPIDIFWDNVGGETLELALAHSARFARFIECGMISVYNTGDRPLKNTMLIITRELSINGFIVTSLEKKYVEEFYREVPAKIARGELKYVEDVTRGLELAGHAILAVQKGANKGKSVVVVAEE